VAQPQEHEGCTVGLVLATGNPEANDQARKLSPTKGRKVLPAARISAT